MWAWTSEKLARASKRAEQVRDEHPEVPEFGLTLIKAEEVKAWTLATAVAYLMKVDVCYRLSGALQLFVGLTDITELDASDPRAKRPKQDPAAAAQALREYAGPASVHLGSMLFEALKGGSLGPVVEVIYGFCERLEDLSASPVGRDTPAAEEAAGLAQRLRRAAESLSVPPGHPTLAQAVKQTLDLLEGTAKDYDAWPEQSAELREDGN